MDIFSKRCAGIFSLTVDPHIESRKNETEELLPPILFFLTRSYQDCCCLFNSPNGVQNACQRNIFMVAVRGAVRPSIYMYMKTDYGHNDLYKAKIIKTTMGSIVLLGNFTES